MHARYCFRCGREFFQFEIFCPQCGTQRRFSVNSGILEEQAKTTEEVINQYFHAGTSYKKIIFLLKTYRGVTVSLSTLKRFLKKSGLKRKGRASIDHSVRRIIELELQRSAGIKGYRSIWHKLRTDYGITVNRDEVMNTVRDIDPEKSAMRKARKL